MVDLARKNAKEKTGDELASDSGLRAVLDPTQMSDAEATKLGFKTYQHGVSYNGGNSPTIQLAAGGGVLNTVNNSSFIPYQMSDGSWRLRGNFVATLDSLSRSLASFSINSVTPSGTQVLFAGTTVVAVNIYRATCSTSVFTVAHSTDTTNTYYVGFDVALSSKPNWAY